MRGSDRKLCFSKKERGKIRKDYMERIMNDENDCDHNVEDAVDTKEFSITSSFNFFTTNS